MATSVEVLRSGDESVIGEAAMRRTAVAAARIGMRVAVTSSYHGNCDWLCIYGSGHKHRGAAMRRHVARGRKVVAWDLGYFTRGKDPKTDYIRCSINASHPQEMISATKPDASRWDAHKLSLREDYSAEGRIIVVGLGSKSRDHLHLRSWEVETLIATQKRFPDVEILYRPKPRPVLEKGVTWPLVDGTTPVEDLLKGARLVICRHSNVAVDACIAGVPVECEDGAAHWLYKKDSMPSADRRLDFLKRLSWWQWKLTEMEEAWKFLRAVCD